MEEKHMESLYCLMNINTERKYVKSITFNILLPSSDLGRGNLTCGLPTEWPFHTPDPQG